MTTYLDFTFTAQRFAVLCMLVAFVATFAITRAITRRIRAERASAEAAEAAGAAKAAGAAEDIGPHAPSPGPGAPSPAASTPAPTADEEQDKGKIIKDIEIGGVHIHHQVWGLLFMLAAGILSFAFEMSTPWLQMLAVVFGIGAALVLDEFALWLHLDDVYWSPEGQKSVDAILATVLVMTALTLGEGPLGVSLQNVDDAPWVLAYAIVFNLVLVVITLMKGKIMMAAIAFFVPMVGLFGAVRLARVPSWWAGRFYATRPKKLERAQEREMRRRERIARVRARLAGQPDPPPLAPSDDLSS